MKRSLLSILGLVAVLIGMTGAQAATATFGWATVGSTQDTGDANYMNAWQFATSSTQSGTVSSMSVYVSGPVSAAPNNKFQLAVYSDSGNAPASRLAASASGAILANAWNTVSLKVSLRPSTRYWLAYNTNAGRPSENNVPVDASGGGRQVWRAQRFGSWPAAFGAVQGSDAVTGSIYATYVPAGGSTDTSPPSTPTQLKAVAATSTRIDLSWNASTDNVGVTGYRVYRGGTQIGTAASTSYSATGLSPATSYSFTVAAYDAAGNVSPQSTAAAATTLAGDVTPPSVSLTAPADGATVSGSITVSASASDNVGVAGVQFERDGTNLGSEVLSPPYSVSLDTASLANGVHTLAAVARDAAGNAATSKTVSVTVDNTAGGAPLLQQSDLTYLGAFVLPPSSNDQASFSYGGTALAYNPASNSLFVVGHDWYQLSAEVSIPPLVTSSTTSALNTASLLQPFTDATNGKIDLTGGTNNKIGGQLVYQGRLYGSVYVYYDATDSQVVSHWARPSTSLSTGTATGLFQVGSVGAGFVSGYMGEIPPAWRGLFGGPALTGNCCIPIISRTSFGPALSVFDPAALGVANPVPATPLVYYPASNPTLGAWGDSWNPAAGILWDGATTIRGVVFPGGSRSVLFFGTQGIGPFCYGEGTSDPSLAGQPTPDGSVWCYDPDDSYKGTHGYPYVSEVWAYDADDLLAVKNGQKQPWDVKPYATWTLSLPFGSSTIGGAAYDPATGTIYLSQQYGNGTDPVIHAFKVP